MRPVPAALLLPLLGLAACARVEGTGRSQLLLTTPAQEQQLGLEAYQQARAQEKPCTDAAVNAFVERVGRRIAAAAPDKGFAYEFTVFQSGTVNAYCLPGGKVAVYTAILPYCRNEAGLAAVLGHEIGHAIARHGGERMSQQMAMQASGAALAAALEAKGVQPTNRNLILAGAGALAQVGVLLPYSRDHELEADWLGLTYMAKAGYDPQEAVAFWERFSALGASGPVFLSTHPASGERARRLAERMPAALALYQAAPERRGAGAAVPAAGR